MDRIERRTTIIPSHVFLSKGIEVNLGLKMHLNDLYDVTNLFENVHTVIMRVISNTVYTTSHQSSS